MSTVVLVILVIIVAQVGGTIFQKRRATRAMTREHVEAAVPVARALDAGVKASGSLLHRVAKSGGRLESMSGKTEVIPLGGDAHEWRVRLKGGLMIFQVLPTGGGVRVEGWAEEVTIAQFGTSVRSGPLALGFALGNALNRAIGVPRDAGGLLRRRRRVFRAVLAAQERSAAGSPAA